MSNNEKSLEKKVNPLSKKTELGQFYTTKNYDWSKNSKFTPSILPEKIPTGNMENKNRSYKIKKDNKKVKSLPRVMTPYVKKYEINAKTKLNEKFELKPYIGNK